MKKMKLVMVGNGMAGVRTLEELLKLAPDLYDITVFGAEPHPNYNRILLSPVLAGEQEILDAIAGMTVLELSELIKEMEEKFGVSAAAAVAVAGPAGGGAAAAPAEEKIEFTVVLASAGDKKIEVIKEVRAITGLGLVTPVGNDVATTWSALLEGRSGGAPISLFDASGFSVRIAAEVKGFNAADWMPVKETRRSDTFIHYGMAAGLQAWKDCGVAVAPDGTVVSRAVRSADGSVTR